MQYAQRLFGSTKRAQNKMKELSGLPYDQVIETYESARKESLDLIEGLEGQLFRKRLQKLREHSSSPGHYFQMVKSDPLSMGYLSRLADALVAYPTAKFRLNIIRNGLDSDVREAYGDYQEYMGLSNEEMMIISNYLSSSLHPTEKLVPAHVGHSGESSYIATAANNTLVLREEQGRNILTLRNIAKWPFNRVREKFYQLLHIINAEERQEENHYSDERLLKRGMEIIYPHGPVEDSLQCEFVVGLLES